MKMIRERRDVESTYYCLSWSFVREPGSGFSFLCDERGTVDEGRLSAAALANLEGCRRGAVNGEEVRHDGILKYCDVIREPAVGECTVCKREVPLTHSLTNTCECGAEYNLSGQRLAPREQWGEETGESLDEIERGNLRVY